MNGMAAPALVAEIEAAGAFLWLGIYYVSDRLP